MPRHVVLGIYVVVLIKMDKNNKIYWLIGIALAIVILYPYLSQMKFAISDSDYTCDPIQTINLPDTSFNVSNGTIYYITPNMTKIFSSGQDYWNIDNDTSTVYSSFPDLIGTHKIHKISYTLKENDTNIEFKRCYVIYTKEIQNTTGPTVYVNRTINQTVYVNQTIEVIKQITIEPTFFQKYGISSIIFVVMGVIVLYLIFKEK